MSVWATRKRDDGTVERAQVRPEDIPAAESHGWVVEGGQAVTTRGVFGTPDVVAAEDAGKRARMGETVETGEERREREYQKAIEDAYSGVGYGAAALGLGVLRGGTLGLSDLALRGLDAEGEVGAIREERPWLSLGGEVLGTLGTGGAGLARTPASLAVKATQRIGGRGVGGAVARGAAEGAVFGAGEGLSQVSLSDDPLTVERVGAALTSNALYGAALGAGAGVFAKAAEKGLGRARRMLDDAVEGRLGKLGETSTDDLAGRLGSYHDEVADSVQDVWDVLRKAEKGTEMRKILKPLNLAHGSKRGALPNRVLKNKIRLAERPGTALGALEESAQVMDDLVKHTPAIRQELAAAGRLTPEIDAKLAKLPGLAQANATMRADIKAMTAGPGVLETTGQKIVKGGAFSGVMGLASAVGAPTMLALPAAAMLSDKIGGLVFSRLGNASKEVAERTAKAVSRVLDVGQKVAARSPTLAIKAMTAAKLGPSQGGEQKEGRVGAFKARAAELQAQIQAGPTGKAEMTLAARRRVADQLRPLRAVSPLMADKIESLAARKVEFLADKLPRRSSPGTQFGPDRWRPTDSEISKFAKYVAAVEDPVGVIERVADGTVSYQEAEALREVYPEIYADMQRQIVEQLPELRETLPFRRRVMMSVLFGVPVDPSMEPRIAEVLQGSYQSEPGTEGGTEAPRAQPQFGSVAKSDSPVETPTPAQERAG